MASSFGNQASKHSGAAFSMGKSSKPKAKKLQDEGPGYYEREGAFGAQASSTRSSTPAVSFGGGVTRTKSKVKLDEVPGPETGVMHSSFGNQASGKCYSGSSFSFGGVKRDEVDASKPVALQHTPREDVVAKLGAGDDDDLSSDPEDETPAPKPTGFSLKLGAVKRDEVDASKPVAQSHTPREEVAAKAKLNLAAAAGSARGPASVVQQRTAATRSSRRSPCSSAAQAAGVARSAARRGGVRPPAHGRG